MSDIFNQVQTQLSWFTDLAENFWGLLQNWMASFWSILGKLLKNETVNNLQPWLQALASPIALIIIASQINQGFEKLKLKEDLERDNELKRRESDNRRQEILRQYFQQMTELITIRQLAEAFHDAPVVCAAQALTVTVIRSLDSARIGQVISFLRSSELASLEKKNPSILRNADLSLTDLSKANFRSVNLEEANLTRANLTGADFNSAKLFGTKLFGADFNGAYLNCVNLRSAYLEEANLTHANLTHANLTGANLTGANLTGANLFGADLNGAYFEEADLSGTYFEEADLTGADFTGALNLEVKQVKEA